ncbi:MAG: tRNA-splicing ligase [Gammaproteobacteria bacterium SG8_30]|jgi:tRNA-splicing ligase RtcB|nr:MAG: tRNA-splicing ligase [Gammaproteobacteria bacterium SG8_30]
MELSRFERHSEYCWALPRSCAMRVPALLYADEDLLKDMDDKVGEQLVNVASLPGIVHAAMAMPDAHWGYGFPIGGVAAFDPGDGGVVSAGGVGFDISCGVRTLQTGLRRKDVEPIKEGLAHELSRQIPAGVGSTGRIRLDEAEFDRMLTGGAHWAVQRGWGEPADLEHCEDGGRVEDALPEAISSQARRRQRDEMGTLGSGNHYLELQEVAELYDAKAAAVFGLGVGDLVVSIHCGSRGLGHQVGTEFLREMVVAAPDFGLDLPDRELACAPIESALGGRYLGAMRAAMNCALANRQILTQLTRESFERMLPGARLRVFYDVSHNICKEEVHDADDGTRKKLYVHRKGATRAFGPGNPAVPEVFRPAGQPVLIGGSMGTSSYVLAGTDAGEQLAFSSACHGAGRAMSRHQAARRWKGRSVVEDMAERGIVVKSPSLRGVAEEAPGAYKDVTRVVQVADAAGLARRVARLEPVIVLKG